MAEKQYEPPKKIQPIEGLDAERQVRLDTGVESVSASEANMKVRFEEALEKMGPTSPQVRAVAEAPIEEGTKKPSLLDMASVHAVRETQKVPSVQDIQNQAIELRNSFEKPRAVLMGVSFDGNASVSPSALSSLNGHIEHADSSLREATCAVKGVEVGSLVQQDKPPLVRFLRFLTDGDHRVNTIIDDISKLDLKTQKMSPQLLIAVQIKLGFVQQELEFFTNVLNKSLESTKTVMNVQI